MNDATCVLSRSTVLLFFWVLFIGCESNYKHLEDDDGDLLKAGWRRTIGTDIHAGNNEYLLLDGLSMEWSASAATNGYLYAADPGSKEVVWSFHGVPADKRKSELIEVADGMEFVAVHDSGKTFDMKIIRQTDYYVKVLYRNSQEGVETGNQNGGGE